MQKLFNFDQPAELRRVKSKTADAILQFFESMKAGDRFHAQDLRDYVAALVPVAPSSSDRVMRDMRKCGQVMYTVVSRKDSLYEVG